MDVQLIVKLTVGVTAVAVWTTAVYLNLSPIEPLINACQLALVGLGVYHLNQGDKP